MLYAITISMCRPSFVRFISIDSKTGRLLRQICFASNPQISDRDTPSRGRPLARSAVYSLHQVDAPFKLTDAELAVTGLKERAVIDRAIKMAPFDRLQQHYFIADDAIPPAEQGSPAE